MRVEVFMPRLGQSMEEGRVLKWLKPVGAKVERGEVIAEIETDKATVDLEALVTGTVVEIMGVEGEIVPIGTAIAIIDDGKPEPETKPTKEPEVEIVSETELEEKTLSRPLTTLTTSPSKRVKASPAARSMAEEHGVDLRQVQASNPERFINKADVEAYLARREAEPTETELRPRRLSVSPVARQLADEHEVDLTQLEGTGPAGRIVKADVEAWLGAHKPLSPEVSEAEAVKTIPLPRIKRTTARRMAESKATVPHFYAAIDVDMARALALRESLKSRGNDVTINDLILRATTRALMTYPNLNAIYSDDEIHIYTQINLALAVALDDGLITPVIHNCEALSLPDLAVQARGVIERARSGHLRPEDLEDGTFTVSNLGMYGVKFFQAIINPPQAAILAFGALRRSPSFDALDRLIPVNMVTATISADHRVTDGVEVARFLQELKRVLEDGFELM